MSKQRVGVYPGTFDPITLGHMDIIRRGARLFDRIVVGILFNMEKSPLFTVAERVELARVVFRSTPNVEVDTFDGLLVDYARRKHATVIVRVLAADRVTGTCTFAVPLLPSCTEMGLIDTAGI